MWQRKHLCMNISLQHLVQDKSIMHVYVCICIFVYLCMFISICVFVSWHEYITATSGAGSERISSIILSSLALNTQYMQIYANQRVTTAEANILHQKDYLSALHSRLRFVSDMTNPSFPNILHSCIIWGMLRHQKYIHRNTHTHTSQKCTEITITEYPLTKHLVMSNCVTNDT